MSQPNELPLLWQRQLAGPVRGLSLSRESGLLLAWDRSDWLYLLDRGGKVQAQRQLAGLKQACASDDGSALAAVDAAGARRLAHDLTTVWKRRTAEPAAVALDPFGRYAAVAGAAGLFQVLDGAGAAVSSAATPRPLSYLAFVPTRDVIVGSADYGFVAALALAGGLLWRDGLVARVGGLSTDGDGGQVLLACFTEGIQRYNAAGKNLGRMHLAAPCALVAQTFDGGRLAAADGRDGLRLLTGHGDEVRGHRSGARVTALALGPLGRDLYAGLADGRLLALAAGQ